MATTKEELTALRFERAKLKSRIVRRRKAIERASRDIFEADHRLWSIDEAIARLVRGS